MHQMQEQVLQAWDPSMGPALAPPGTLLRAVRSVAADHAQGIEEGAHLATPDPGFV